MKIIERRMVTRNRYGKVVFSNQNLEEHEKETVFFLARFGFDIEVLVPSYAPKSKNPDLLMLGATWEIKAPQTPNKNTVKKKFRKATKQSGGRAIFDLRHLKNDEEVVEKYLLELFVATRNMKRIIIIKKDGRLLDIFK